MRRSADGVMQVPRVRLIRKSSMKMKRLMTQVASRTPRRVETHDETRSPKPLVPPERSRTATRAPIEEQRSITKPMVGSCITRLIASSIEGKKARPSVRMNPAMMAANIDSRDRLVTRTAVRRTVIGSRETHPPGFTSATSIGGEE